MRVVIVGASGNVGTSVLRALADERRVESMLAVARRLPDQRIGGAEWAAADIGSDDLVPLLQGADAVIDLAWLFQPTRDPALTWRKNVLGGIRLFQAVAQAQVPKLVYASSVGAYSPRPNNHRVDESWPTHGWPTASYSREKAYLERVLDAFEHQHPEVQVVRLRPAFIFKREAATEQRRLFGGPFVPHRLARPGLIPLVPHLPALRLQAVHTDDVADAYRLAMVQPVKGAFNIAAEPLIDTKTIAELLGARTVRMPLTAVRAALATAWRMRLTPASPYLFDLAARLPIMDTSRARNELGWSPRHGALDALTAFLEGLRSESGAPPPPLDPSAGGSFRVREITSGVGKRP
ncbi:MAG: NAD-dependent epimerase/dehydratase family protein [Pseudonocardia sp.]|nr:NAD-dependent epimerase/dehydratase family protein [Pseudonocardia sp.]MBO0872691.1 NAD-dependent epimerase/dehydratase family protein [Pseudonocardia sp.]